MKKTLKTFIVLVIIILFVELTYIIITLNKNKKNSGDEKLQNQINITNKNDLNIINQTDENNSIPNSTDPRTRPLPPIN